MVTMTTYTVTTSGDKWVVLKGGKAMSYHRKKSTAVNKAKKSAKSGSGTNKVNVYNTDDKLAYSRSY